MIHFLILVSLLLSIVSHVWYADSPDVGLTFYELRSSAYGAEEFEQVGYVSSMLMAIYDELKWLGDNPNTSIGFNIIES